MDIIFLCVGALCLAEGIDLFAGKDFLIFVGFSKQDEYDLDKVFAVEKWLFLIDAACSFAIGLNYFPPAADYAALAVFALTLPVHVYVFKSRRFKKGGR